jgi:hypothetical protein
MAAKILSQELRTQQYESRKPFIILTDGEPTRLSPNYQFKLVAAVALPAAALLLITITCWRIARGITDSEAFIISPTLSFVDLPQGSVQNRPCGVTSKPAIAGPELYMLYLSSTFRASLISGIFWL